MDIGLKQRLIGAGILILLAIIFVPMLVNRAPPTTADIGLATEPRPDGAIDTRIVPLAPPSGDAAAPPVAGAVTADGMVAGDRVVTVEANPPARIDAVSGEPLGAGAVDAQAQAPDTTIATAPTAPIPTAPVSTPAAPPVSPAITAPAPRPVEPSVAPLPGASTSGRYRVVFGSFVRRENADALLATLSRAGIAARATSTSINGESATRVEAGPYRDRAAAERVRLSAQQVRTDIRGTIVESDDSTAAAQAPASATAPSAAGTAPSTAREAAGFAVQVGAFQSEADAGRLRDRLRGAGFSVFLDEVRTPNGVLHRVRAGPTAARAGAEALRADIRAKLALDGVVVTHP